MREFVAKTHIEAPVEDVWSAISDPNRLPEWLTPIEDVRTGAAGSVIREGDSFAVRMHGRVPGPPSVKVHEVVPESRLRLAAGPFFAHPAGIAMRAEVTLDRADGETDATVRFRCNSVTGPLQSRISGIDVSKEAPATARKLKALVENTARHAAAPV